MKVYIRLGLKSNVITLIEVYIRLGYHLRDPMEWNTDVLFFFIPEAREGRN